MVFPVSYQDPLPQYKVKHWSELAYLVATFPVPPPHSTFCYHTHCKQLKVGLGGGNKARMTWVWGSLVPRLFFPCGEEKQSGHKSSLKARLFLVKEKDTSPARYEARQMCLCSFDVIIWCYHDCGLNIDNTMTVIFRLIPTTAVRMPGYKSCLTIPSTDCFTKKVVFAWMVGSSLGHCVGWGLAKPRN